VQGVQQLPAGVGQQASHGSGAVRELADEVIREPVDLGDRVDLEHLVRQVPVSGVRHLWAVRKGRSVHPLVKLGRDGTPEPGPRLGSIDPDDEDMRELGGVNVCVLRVAVDGRGKRRTVGVEAIFGREYRYRPRALWD
jgi:hypothetical protein